MKFKAAILVNLRQPLVLDEISLCENLKPGQVLVKVHNSGICGSQIGEIDGVKGEDKYLPHLLGHEGSATVVEIGPGVTTVSVDDLVVMHWRKGTGIEAPPPKYSFGHQTINAGWVTTFNEYAIVSENRITSIPKMYNRESAALLGCAVTTGFGVITNNAQLKIGESVVVIGAGGVGLNIVQAAAMTSAHPIIAVDLHDSRLSLAKKMGATHLVNAKKENQKARIKEILKGQPLDVFVDNTGIPEIIELGYSLTSSTGRIVLVGVPKAGSKVGINTLPLHFGKSISGSHGGEAVPQTDIPRYIALEQAGKLDLSSLITSRIPLIEINDGIAGMRAGTVAGRVLINIDKCE